MTFKPLTDDEVEQSQAGPKFAEVLPSQVFSKTADAVLADRIHRLNPARYNELKQAWLWESKIEPRPTGYYD